MHDTPWSTWDEWRQVYSLLYHANPELRRRGCHFAAVWSVRGKLPQPVKCTWDLVEAQLLDIGGVLCSGEQARLCYAMAVTRLVNLATEDAQRGEFALPVSLLASKLGLEKWLVDVRHDCAHHKSMPSLPVLRLACARVLSWLQQEYWQLQCAELAKDESDAFLVQQIATLRRIVDEGEGRMRRESGPQLPEAAAAAQDDNNDEDDGAAEEDSAQDILERIRHFETSRLGRCLHSALVRSPDIRRWYSSLQWLDGSVVDFRVAYAVLAHCFNVLLSPVVVQGDDNEEEEIRQRDENAHVVRALLSREYCSIRRDYLRRAPGSKRLLGPHCDDWSPKELAFMQQLAPDVYQKELRAVARRCLVGQQMLHSQFVLQDLVLPSLRATVEAKKNSTAAAADQQQQFVHSLVELAKQRWGDDKQEEEDWGARFDQLCGGGQELLPLSPSPATTSAAAVAGGESVERTEQAVLAQGGQQEWTRVERGPLGRITESAHAAVLLANLPMPVTPQQPSPSPPAPTTNDEPPPPAAASRKKQRVRLLV